MAAVLDELLTALATTPVLSVAGLASRHGDREALRGVDLALGRGEVVALMGLPGSGKSSLLRCIAGLQPFQQGGLGIEGRPPPRPEVWSRAVGWVFQGVHLPPQLSLGQRLMQAPALAGRPGAAGEARELLARVGLAGWFDALPGQLSAAQAQRAAIAWALAPEPVVLLCDDITDPADLEQAGEVGAAARALASDGLSLLLATHDPALARHADRVVMLRDGRVEAAGAPAELLGPQR